MNISSIFAYAILPVASVFYLFLFASLHIVSCLLRSHAHGSMQEAGRSACAGRLSGWEMAALLERMGRDRLRPRTKRAAAGLRGSGSSGSRGASATRSCGVSVGQLSIDGADARQGSAQRPAAERVAAPVVDDVDGELVFRAARGRVRYAAIGGPVTERASTPRSRLHGMIFSSPCARCTAVAAMCPMLALPSWCTP